MTILHLDSTAGNFLQELEIPCYKCEDIMCDGFCVSDADGLYDDPDEYDDFFDDEVWDDDFSFSDEIDEDLEYYYDFDDYDDDFNY